MNNIAHDLHRGLNFWSALSEPLNKLNILEKKLSN